MTNKDYYAILGVSRDATEKDIKKAYRRLALKHHPDKNDGKDSERFKDITEAYVVLSNPQKKQQYDNPHTSSPPFDISDFFNFGNARRQRVQKGRDVRITLTVSLEDIERRKMQTLNVKTPTYCKECDGVGAKTEADKKICGRCNGSGRIIQQAGMFNMEAVCNVCQGRGFHIVNPCGKCNGVGTISETSTIKIKLQYGLSTNDVMRKKGAGEKIKDGIPGDLIVHLNIKQHERFSWSNFDLSTIEIVPINKALLGTEVFVKNLLDEKIKVTIPRLTRDNTRLRISGYGRTLPNGRKGDLFIVVRYKYPTKLSKEDKEILSKLNL